LCEGLSYERPVCRENQFLKDSRRPDNHLVTDSLYTPSSDQGVVGHLGVGFLDRNWRFYEVHVLRPKNEADQENARKLVLRQFKA
jgi:hypothetical protein